MYWEEGDVLEKGKICWEEGNIQRYGEGMLGEEEGILVKMEDILGEQKDILGQEDCWKVYWEWRKVISEGGRHIGDRDGMCCENASGKTYWKRGRASFGKEEKLKKQPAPERSKSAMRKVFTKVEKT